MVELQPEFRMVIPRRFWRRSWRGIGVAIESRDQTVNAFRPQDGGEFGTPGRHLADCAVEIDVRETAALAQCLATLHCAEQRVIEALHGIAAGRRGMERTEIGRAHV